MEEELENDAFEPEPMETSILPQQTPAPKRQEGEAKRKSSSSTSFSAMKRVSKSFRRGKSSSGSSSGME
jgi:hypothetical protein